MGDRCGGRQGEEQLYRVRKAVISAECSGTKGIHLRHDGFRPADDPETRGQRGLIAAIWQEMAYDGVVRDASPRALEAYVRRICKGNQLADLSVTGCSHVIESLKRWVNRAGSMELRRKVFSELCSGASL